MPRDSFDSLIGISGGPEIAIVQQINLRQLQLQQSLGTYANHQIATPDLHIARRAEAFVPKIVGEDGQEMTMERRRELMKGKPTMADLAAAGEDPMNVGRYDMLFNERDIGQEELGASAMANRQGFRQIRVATLELPSELLARQGLPGEVRDMSLCCYSAPCIGDRRSLMGEMAIAVLKLRALSPANLGPEQILMSSVLHALIGAWSNKLEDRLLEIPIYHSDRLINEIRICATSSRPELSGRYAALFVERHLYDALSIDVSSETVMLPAVDERK